MSYVAFHDQEEEVRLRGSERAHANGLCRDLFMAAVSTLLHHDGARKLLIQSFPEKHYIRGAPPRDQHYGWSNQQIELPLELCDPATYLTTPDGGRHELFALHLNTALALGNDVVRFLARLHGQCEVHGWIAGKDREWLADLIAEGQASKVMRDDEGWTDVALFLRRSKDRPVVMSYSVTHAFPNPALVCPAGLDEAAEDRWTDQFYAKSAAAQWAECMKVLEGHGPNLRIGPDTISHGFGDGMNGFEFAGILLAKAREGEKR